MVNFVMHKFTTTFIFFLKNNLGREYKMKVPRPTPEIPIFGLFVWVEGR